MRARIGSGGEATGALGAEIAVREAAGTSTVESCQITHSIASQSPGRFMAVVTITNSGDSMVRGWTLRWAYPEVEPAAMPRLGDGWNAAVSVDAVGGQAIDVEASRLIPAGGSTTIAFVGTGGDGVPDPTDFTLNGVRCG
jgi:mannan endo-1,4-beta-mannosidase